VTLLQSLSTVLVTVFFLSLLLNLPQSLFFCCLSDVFDTVSLVYFLLSLIPILGEAAL
jgi:hypothetical protein